MERAIFTHNKYPEFVKEGERIRLLYDCEYTSEGRYGLDTPEETAAAEREEQEKLDSGQWVALVKVSERLCPACKQWELTDTLHGIVVDNSADGDEDAAFRV